MQIDLAKPGPGKLDRWSVLSGAMPACIWSPGLAWLKPNLGKSVVDCFFILNNLVSGKSIFSYFSFVFFKFLNYLG